MSTCRIYRGKMCLYHSRRFCYFFLKSSSRFFPLTSSAIRPATCMASSPDLNFVPAKVSAGSGMILATEATKSCVMYACWSTFGLIIGITSSMRKQCYQSMTDKQLCFCEQLIEPLLLYTINPSLYLLWNGFKTLAGSLSKNSFSHVQAEDNHAEWFYTALCYY